jgi:O-antigen ligase
VTLQPPTSPATLEAPFWLSYPQRPNALVVSALTTLIVLVVNGIAPMSMPFVIVSSAILQVYWIARDGRLAELTWPWSSMAWMIPAVAWWIASLTWTSNLAEGAGATASLALILVSAFVASAAFDKEAGDVHHALVTAMLTAFACVALYRAVDQVSGLAITTGLVRAVPLLATSIDVDQTSAGGPVVLGFATNKGMAWLVVLLFPMLLAVRDVVSPRFIPLARGLLIVLVVLAVARSEHETSKLALAFGALVFAMARWDLTLLWRMLALGWIASIVLVVPLALFAWGAGLHRSSVVQTTGQHRILIWGVTAERVLKAPLAGYGIASTRTNERTVGATAPLAEGTAFKPSTNLHAHNIFLQTWHELGAIGAIVLLLAGWPALRWLRDAPANAAPFACATFGVFGVTASLSWSLVAAWFLAFFAFAGIVMLYVSGRPRQEGDPLPRPVPVS